MMQQTHTKRIADTISFQHHIQLPAISATDRLIPAIKQLQDAITKHTGMEAINEEKAMDTLRELLTTPATTTACANIPLVLKPTCPSTHIAALHTDNMLTQAKPQQHNLC